MKNNTNHSRAFTLIELLVVIAIIGILSSVVLASISSARQSARESSIISSLNNSRSQAELYRNNNSSYADLCSNPKIQKIMDSLRNTADDAACFDAVYNDNATNNDNERDVYIDGGSANLAQRDWGIGVKSDGNYYVGSPLGAGKVSKSPAGSNVNWQEAKDACASNGGRLARPSAIDALWQIDGDAPNGFGAYIWSALESGAPSGQAWEVGMVYGNIYHNLHSTNRDAHCVL